MGLLERNERLFFRVLLENTQELLPIVDLPAAGAYCKSHGLMFRQPPRGLYIGLRDKGAPPPFRRTQINAHTVISVECGVADVERGTAWWSTGTGAKMSP